jgi:hypothetical protein
MSDRKSKFLRYLLAASTLLIIGSALLSYLRGSGWSIGYLLAAGNAENRTVWIGCGSHAGCMTLAYESMPRKLYDSLSTYRSNRPAGMHVRRIGKHWTLWYLRSSSVPTRWWFHGIHQTFQMPLLNASSTAPAARSVATYPFTEGNVAIPDWFLFLLAGAYPFWRLLDLPNQRRRKRFVANQCVGCGYDLRHTPERCPECGLVPGVAPPPSGAITLFRAPPSLGPTLWWRLWFYPIFFGLFALVFSSLYQWYWRK